MQQVLELDGVRRTYGDRTALDDVSFTVRPGRLTGFVGANGAGKTTAMRIIMGVLAADAGRVTYGGAPLTRELRRSFGYMPEERGLYPKMSLVDQLVYLGRVHGLSAPAARARTTQLLDQLGLGDRSKDLLQTLSLGNQQRVQVAAALLHEPVLLVLDEPFSGLDPIAIDAMGELLRSRAQAGVPVLFSSHQLELVERLCDDVVIIDDGRVVAAGEAVAVRSRTAGRRWRLRLEPHDAVGGAVDAVPGARLVGADGGLATVELGEGDDQALLAAAQARGVVREFGPVLPSLAEIFREVIR